MARPMKRKLTIALLLAAALVAAGVWQAWPFLWSHVSPTRPDGRRGGPARRPWATALREPGLENLYRVTEDLYRGAQPGPEGMKRLEAMGIRTVVNLRQLHSDKGELAGTKLRGVHIHVNPFDPEEQELVRFLQVMQDPNRVPVFVHCQRGIDRTGMMCAVYRMVVCGWSRDEAIGEMMNGPFGYDGIFRNVPDYLRRLDVARLKRISGQEPPVSRPTRRAE